MSSDAALDAKLTELLRVMVSRLPPNKKLPTAVVQQLLRTKYGDTYPEAYVSSHEGFIADTILKLSIAREKAAMAAASASSASSSAVSDDDEEESDEDSGSGDDDTEDEEASAESDDEEGDESDDDDDDDEEEEDTEDEDDDASGDEPDRKKARAEEVDAIAQKAQQTLEVPSSSSPGDGTNSTVSLAERCKAMAECLRKLSYRVRAPTAEESLEAYLQNFLIAEFQKHGMDPDKYSKADIKRYHIKREVELLQQDGASLSLDRRNRAGRGFSNVSLTPAGDASGAAAAAAPPTVAKQTSMFLDDE